MQNILSRVIHRLFSINKILWLSQNSTYNANFLSNENVHFRIANDNDIYETSNFEDGKYYSKIYSKMLKNGDVIILGYLEGNCVFRLCIQMSGIVLFDGGKVYNLKKNEGYIHYVFCAPEARGKGIHKSSLYYLKKQFPMYKFYTAVKQNNIPSLSAFKSQGFEINGSVFTLNILFTRFAFIKNK